MLENNSGTDKKKNFIHERIIKKSDRKERVLKHLIKIVVSAVIFALVATVTAIFAKPRLEKFIIKESETTKESISIPKDVPEVTETSSHEETTEYTLETESVEEIVNAIIDSHPYSIKELKTVYQNLEELCSQMDNSIVSVDSVKNEKDWFDNPVEKSGHYSGVVVAKTETELMILCPITAAGEADSIRVRFLRGTISPATLNSFDTISGLAIVSVKAEDMEERDWESVRPAVLGNSYQVKRGDFVVAVGSPEGSTYSSSYGSISYVDRDISVTDGMARVFYFDKEADAAAGSFIINTEGEVIAWFTDEYGKDEVRISNIAYGISDYKILIENMINAVPSPYLGIKAVEIGLGMKDRGMPEGVYIGEVIQNSPVYNAGIQPGDVLVRIGDTDIKTLAEFRNSLYAMHVDDEVELVIMRNNGKDEYKELKFYVNIGVR